MLRGFFRSDLINLTVFSSDPCPHLLLAALIYLDDMRYCIEQYISSRQTKGLKRKCQIKLSHSVIFFSAYSS